MLIVGLATTIDAAAQAPAPSADSADRDQVLHVAVLELDNFVAVGSANEGAAGLYRHEGDTTWSHHGWENTRNFGLAAVPTDPSIIFLACGNGVLRTMDGGASWKLMTGWRITEVLDVVVDPNAPNHLYIATAYGVWRSVDLGESWDPMNRGIPEPQSTFTQTLAMDRRHAGHLIAGTEEGLFRTTNGALEWAPVGPRGVAIRDVVQSPVDPELWIAGSEEQGVLVSRDGGLNWAFPDHADPLGNVYAVAMHPTNDSIVATVGHDGIVHRSADAGRTWTTAGVVGRPAHALLFDPNTPRRLWAGTMGDGVYYSDNRGEEWKPGGLSGAVVWNMSFFGPAPMTSGGSSDD
jgi:photosystem II stability/assembly factor-like uncharacterized protein